MITAEVAVYPLKTSDATNVINNSINTLQNSDVSYTVDSMNTKITGTKEQIFDSLNKIFTEAENSGGEINMVVTLSNSAK